MCKMGHHLPRMATMSCASSVHSHLALQAACTLHAAIWLPMGPTAGGVRGPPGPSSFACANAPGWPSWCRAACVGPRAARCMRTCRDSACACAARVSITHVHVTSGSALEPMPFQAARWASRRPCTGACDIKPGPCAGCCSRCAPAYVTIVN